MCIRDSQRAVLPGLELPHPRLVVLEDVVGDAGAARVGEELGPEADKPARGLGDVYKRQTGPVVDHLLHAALADGQQLGDGAEMLLGRVDREALERLVDLAVDQAGNHLRLADRHLVALAAHLLDQDGQRQLTTALHLPGVGRLGGQYPDRDVADQLSFNAVLDQARSDLGALRPPDQRGGVGADRHRDRRLIDGDQGQRDRVVRVGQRLPDGDLRNPGPGDIIARAGIPEITIGETLTDPDNPIPLPLITVDEPAISMTIGTNTSPLVGRAKGTKVTARLIKDRIERELVGNVSIRVLPTETPNAWEVQGRGELALAILVEQMRREGYEMTVGKPQVVTRLIDGKIHEPFERLTIDAPEEHLGTITQLLAVRKGRMEQMVNHGTGWVRMEFVVPSRGLIGFRTEFLTDTHGTGIANHVFEDYEPWVGELKTRQNGSLVADRTGAATSYAMFNLQERGAMFLEPTTEVYEGMIVGENSRVEDMDVNICKERKLTNVRSATSEVLERLVPSRKLSLEQALEFCREDECVEVTPVAVRIRKLVLPQHDRARTAARAKTAARS